MENCPNCSYVGKWSRMIMIDAETEQCENCGEIYILGEKV